MVAPLERDEARARDERGDEAALLEGHDAIVPNVHDQRRSADLRAFGGDVDRAEHLAEAIGRLPGCRHSLELVEGVELLG